METARVIQTYKKLAFSGLLTNFTETGEIGPCHGKPEPRPLRSTAINPERSAIAVSGTALGWNQTQHCKLPGLVPDQQQLCRRNPELMHSIVFAAQQTGLVCQKAMADMRWNCSSIQLAPRFNPDLSR
eukprot:g24988.t1